MVVIFALLILNGIDAIRNPRVYYQDQWVSMRQLHNQHTPLYCTFKPVSALYDSFAGLFLLPVSVCFDSQWELNRWIDAHYPDRRP